MSAEEREFLRSHYTDSPNAYQALSPRASTSNSSGLHPGLGHRKSTDSSISDNPLNQRKWGYKALALICTLLISVGAHYSAHTLGSLKATIKEELGITNAQYGALQSTVSMVNTFLPLLGGIFIDTFGTATGSILATIFITIGNTIISISTHQRSFHTMVVGKILYGLGSGAIVTIQETILGHWFKGRSLSIALALQISSSRVASFLSMGTAVPIAHYFNFYGAAFWASTFVCAFSMAVNLLYVWLMRHIKEQMTTQELAKLKRKTSFSIRLMLFLPAAFWLIASESFILGSAWTSFLHINTELIKLRFGTDDRVAAWNASISQIMPIFLVPCLGYILDRFGHRPSWIIFAGLTFTLSILFVGFTHITPVVGMVIYSISLSIGPVALITSIPLIIPLSSLGTALGLYKSASNTGDTIVDILVGRLQDIGPKTLKESSNSYFYVMIFYIFWGCFSMGVGALLLVVDRNSWMGLLTSQSPERKQIQRELTEYRREQDPRRLINLPNWKQYLRWWNWTPLVVLGFLLIVSWVLFVKFLV
ncbi:hypothetical protein H4219_002799 [Mycoemilia scoparia]|uniref:Lysosomal dipeptide transporter MFSD1 n=1 Tax=Mycoemilia scoparia TaxID=417184 RepID=A0A9W8A612_9FUNG|nr:hypothetical protein H4219_002799 [Mycoemilia scoparia]